MAEVVNYISREDIVYHLGEQEVILMTDVENGAIENKDKLNQGISIATSMTNSALISAGYTVPLSCANGKMPFNIIIININITRFMCYQKRATEEVIYRYEEAKEMLKQIANGTLALICQDGELPTHTNNEIICSSSCSNTSSFFDSICRRDCY